MSNTRIEAGDVVNVFFSAHQPLRGMRVEYLPCATGDSWTLIDREGAVFNVQQFDYMIRTHKKGEFQP